MVDVSNLVNIFKSANAERAINKMIEIATRLGLSLTSIDFMRNMLFGYLEGYLNGATCPNCFEVLGLAKEVPDKTICGYCGKKVNVIKITPLRMYLTLANNADIFKIVPDKVKMPDTLGIVKRFGETILKFYDAVTLDMILDPLLAWMKEKRPDLYYTIVFFPDYGIPEPVQDLYSLDFRILNGRDIQNMCKKYGLNKCDPTILREVLLEGLELAFEKKIQKFKEDPTSVSFQGVKIFASQVEDLKGNFRKVLEQYLKN